jgi:DNA-binding IclR family transcriptional regulator
LTGSANDATLSYTIIHGGESVHSFEKVHRILELLRTHYKTGLTNKEICEQLRLPPSTSYRILANLRRYGYVFQRKEDTRYFLGYNLLRLAESVVEGTDAAEICLPFLEDLHYDTDETTFFAIRSGSHCVALEICGHINTRINVGRGEVMPMHCAASGKAVLAFLPERERDRIIAELDFKAYTPYTNTDPSLLRTELADIHRTGIAYNMNGLHMGFCAVATPVFSSRNSPIGSIAVVGSSVDLDRPELEDHARLLLDASVGITEKLGGSFPARILDYWEQKT